MHEISLQRVYETERKPGMRVLVDRLWPRGLQKEAANVDLWLKEIGPTTELRKWFGHDVARFDEFRARYIGELKDNPTSQAAFSILVEKAQEHDVILVYGAKDEEHNQAVVIFDLLKHRLIK
jgi:uncharacterized protein YeaO (DUF488 family)